MSIAAQLRVLASADKKVDTKSRASFLFDPKVAADTDAQTIFNLSRNGLTELIKLNPTFLAFENTLFARVPEASHLLNITAESRKKLDASIICFLRILSPYFLNKASHKCLEFLIRCYSIHEYNVDAVVACILPYHETALFPRMLRILNLDKNPTFQFLNTCKKQNIALARSTLVRRCIIDPSMLQFVCDMGKPVATVSGLQEYLNTLGVNTSASVNKASVSFYTVTVVDALTTVDKVTDDIINNLLPYIISGLYATRFPEYQTAAYMILTQLCSRTHLRPRILGDVFAALCKNIPSDATPQALQYPLLCLLAVFQSQSSVLEAAAGNDNDVPLFPHAGFNAVLRIANFPDALVIAAERYDIEPLLWPYLHALTNAIVFIGKCKEENATNQTGHYIVKEKLVKILLEVVTKVNIKSKFSSLVQWVLATFAGPYAHHKALWSSTKKALKEASVHGKPVIVHWTAEHIRVLTTILRALDALYPALMDEALETIIDKLDRGITTGFSTLSLIEQLTTATNDNALAAHIATIKQFIAEPLRELHHPKKYIVGLISFAFKGTRHEVLTNSDTTLLLSFSHSKTRVRLSALDRMDAIVTQQLREDGVSTDPTVSTAEDLAMEEDEPVTDQVTFDDDELAFLSGPLVEEAPTMLALQPTMAGDTSTSAEDAVSIGLTDVATLILTRLAVDTDVRVLRRVLGLGCLAHNAVVSDARLVDALLALLDRAFAILGTGPAASLYAFEPSTDVHSLHNPTGARNVILTTLSFATTFLTRVHRAASVLVHQEVSLNADPLQQARVFTDAFVPYFIEAITFRTASCYVPATTSVSLYKAHIELLNGLNEPVYDLAATLGNTYTSLEKNAGDRGIVAPMFAGLAAAKGKYSSSLGQDRNKLVATILAQTLLAHPALLISVFIKLILSPFGTTPPGYATAVQRLTLLASACVFKMASSSVSLLVALAKVVLFVLLSINTDNTIDKSVIASTHAISTDAPSLLGLVNDVVTSMLSALPVPPTAPSVPFLSWGIVVTDALVAISSPVDTPMDVMSVVQAMFFNPDNAVFSYATTHAELIARTFILSLPYGETPSAIRVDASFFDLIASHVPKTTELPIALLAPVAMHPLTNHAACPSVLPAHVVVAETFAANTLKRIADAVRDDRDVAILLPLILVSAGSTSKAIREAAVSVITTVAALQLSSPALSVLFTTLTTLEQNIRMDAKAVPLALSALLGADDAVCSTSALPPALAEELVNIINAQILASLPPSVLLETQSISTLPLSLAYLSLASSILRYFDRATTRCLVSSSCTTALIHIGAACKPVTHISTHSSTHAGIVRHLFISVVRSFVQQLIAHIDTNISSSPIVFDVFVKLMSKDFYLALTSSSFLTATVVPLLFSFRDIVIRAIDMSFFKLLDKSQQQILFDTLLTISTTPEDSVQAYYGTTSSPAYPVVSHDIIMNAFYQLRLPATLFAKYVLLPKSKTRTLEKITVAGFDASVKALTIVNLVLANSDASGIKGAVKLVRPLLQLLMSTNTLAHAVTASSVDKAIGESDGAASMLARVHNLQHIVLYALFLIASASGRVTAEEFTRADAEVIMTVITNTMLAPKLTGLEIDTSAPAFVSATLEDPQRSQARDTALQVLSFLAANAKALVAEVVLDLLSKLLFAVSTEEAVARASSSPFPSLVVMTPSAVCTSANVVQGSMLDVLIRSLRSIVGPVVAVATKVEGSVLSNAHILRVIVDAADKVHSSTFQVVLAAALRYLTAGTLSADDTDGVAGAGADEPMCDRDNAILYATPVDIAFENEVDGLVPADLIGGAIALTIAKAFFPAKLSLASCPATYVAQDLDETIKSSLSVELTDVAQRLLVTYTADVQVTVLAHILSIVYAPAPGGIPTTEDSNDASSCVGVGSVIDGSEYYLLQGFPEHLAYALYAWRVGALQFISDVSAHQDFRFNISSLSRVATHVRMSMSEISSDTSDAAHTLEVLGDAFTLLFSRLIVSLTYAELARDAEATNTTSVSKLSHWRTVVQSTDAVLESLASLLATAHFTTVFKNIFSYTLNPESIDAIHMLSLRVGADVFTATRKFGVKKLLMLLIQRVRIERERVHAEAFIHLMGGASNNKNASYKSYADVLDTLPDDSEDDDAYLGMTNEERATHKKQKWIVELQRREASLMGVVPVLSTQLFYPFLNHYNRTTDNNALGTYSIEEDLQNLQVAMLCVDELSDVACLMLAPLSSPAAALAALSGIGAKRAVIQLPKKVLDSLLEVYGMVMKVASVAAAGTFALTASADMHVAWPVLLSSSLLCMATLAARTGVQSLRYLNQLVPLALAIMDKVAMCHMQHTLDYGACALAPAHKKPRISDAAPLPREHLELLQLSSLSVLDTLLRSFPAFLSPYLDHILSVLLHSTLPEQNPISAHDLRFESALSAYTVKDANNASGTTSNSVSSAIAMGGLVSTCLQALAMYVSPRVLLPPVFKAWNLAVSRGSLSASRLLALVGRICQTLNSIAESSMRQRDDDESPAVSLMDDDDIDFSDDEERNISLYVDSLFQFFMTAISLRKMQANPESDGFTFAAVEQPVVSAAPGVHQFSWSVSQAALIVPVSAQQVLWSDAALGATESALEVAFMQMIYKLDEIQLRQIFVTLMDWVGLNDKVLAFKEDAVGLSELIAENLPQAMPFFRLMLALTNDLKHIFVPYLLDIMDMIVALLGDSGKSSKDERKKLKALAKSKTNGKRFADAEDTVDDDNFLRRFATIAIWRAQTSALVVQTIHSALRTDTMMARGSHGQTTAIIAKNDMEKLLPALANHIEVAYTLRLNIPPMAAQGDSYLVFPTFVDKVLIPCLGQLSVHLAYSNPALWDTLTQVTMAHSKHASAIVRFAALSALHIFIKRNNEDFLLLLPKIVGYISELMQDTNVLVEKLAQDVIKTIEKISGESLSDYLK